MKLSELITWSQTLLAEHGDLDLFDKEGYQICNLSMIPGSNFPIDWLMPDKIIQIDSAK